MDRIDFVCISLYHRDDRRKKVSSTFSRIGILDKVVWWCVNKHPTSGVVGCFESHYNILKSDQFRKPYLCIFEDDVTISDENIEKFQRVINRLQDFNVDILNMDPAFDYHFADGPLPDTHYGYGFNCSAYICPRHRLPSICNYLSDKIGMPIDIAIYGLEIIVTRIFEQEKVDSDLNSPLMSKFNAYLYRVDRIFSKNWLLWIMVTKLIFVTRYREIHRRPVEVGNRRVAN